MFLDQILIYTLRRQADVLLEKLKEYPIHIINICFMPIHRNMNMMLPLSTYLCYLFIYCKLIANF